MSKSYTRPSEKITRYLGDYRAYLNLGDEHLLRGLVLCKCLPLCIVVLLMLVIKLGCTIPTPRPTASPMVAAPTTTTKPIPTVTVIIVPTTTPAPSPTPYPTGVIACVRPPDDYARVEINGETLNRRTVFMLDVAVELYAGPGDLKRVTQGSYTEAIAASFGTHAGGGAVDISIRDPRNPDQILLGETAAMVTALRRAGFAAWFRDVGDVYPGSPMHIHAIAVGDQELSPAAQEQLTGAHGYFRGMDGLPHEDGARPDPHGGPIVCDWMLELGYRDLR